MSGKKSGLQVSDELFCANYPALSTMQADLFGDRSPETTAQQQAAVLLCKEEGRWRESEGFGQ